ncbi:ATP-binding protein [Actinoallomurus iriomotensis]|nr:ATP-binding protein [Actinoallomurus iriomotensis]
MRDRFELLLVKPCRAPSSTASLKHITHREMRISMATVILGALDIVGLPAEVAPARHWLRKLLADDHAEIADDVVLMACEAVTNSICHSDSGRQVQYGDPGTVALVVSATRGIMRVAVTDAGSRTKVPHVADDGPDAVNGRGLHLIDLLSGGRWGTSCHDGGRTVWFEVPIGRGA